MVNEYNERVLLARSYFKKGYNCCQSVAMAFCDITGLSEEKTAAICSGFGGGMGRMREVCGAFSGMVFVAGAMESATDPNNIEQRTKNYALVQKFASAYKEANGSIICRELLKLRTKEQESPAPSQRNEAYYHARPCEMLVASAVEIIERELKQG